MHDFDDPQAEKIFELQQEIIRLRGQITYLQEELASAEDRIYELERSIEDNNDEH
jgi:predicted  nucleic acid-binding Zn-ribbon protein